MEPQKTPIANTILRKKNKTEGIMLPDFRNQNSMILAPNTHRPKEQNREPRNKPTHLKLIIVQQRRQEYVVVVVQSPRCPTLCDPMDCSSPGLPVTHHLLKFAEVHVHCIGDAIQTSHPLTSSSPSVINLTQHQGLFQ